MCCRVPVIWVCLNERDMVTVMHRAYQQGMANGDYVFIYYDRLFDEDFDFQPWGSEPGVPTGLSESEARAAFYPLKGVGSKIQRKPTETADQRSV